MMEFNVSGIVPEKNFFITGMSYIGRPKSNTAMFIAKKVEKLLANLGNARECLVFVENGIAVSDSLREHHAFHFSDCPQLAYTRFAERFAAERFKEEQQIKYIHTPEGYYLSETAQVGRNAYIEPNCLIGHHVVIGENAKILTGSVIRNAVIGDNFLCNEYAVIGSNGFTMTEDEQGNKLRIPTLGRVMIGDNVEIGAHDNISCGSGGDTVIENNVKLDALVLIGHDAYIENNVEIAAGNIVSGFVRIGAYTFAGVNAAFRNRITVGDHTFIGMGAAVMRSVKPNVTAVGNPAISVPK